MQDALESVRANPIARRFEIGEILFAQFSCPQEEAGLWTKTDFLMHIVRGASAWRTAAGTGFAKAGETVFFKKGAYVLPPHPKDVDLCVQLYFVPDTFVRETIAQLTADLPSSEELVTAQEMAIRVSTDLGLAAFFQAMCVYFAADEDPPEALLKLKLRELLTTILLSRTNPTLAAYLRSLERREAPSIAAIMEANYHHNLPLETFAQMCHRSLSAFKRGFRGHYGTSPGRWLLQQRLVRSGWLLRTTRLTITEIMLESGFEDPSHFCRSFKARFGRSPSSYRRLAEVTAGLSSQTI